MNKLFRRQPKEKHTAPAFDDLAVSRVNRSILVPSDDVARTYLKDAAPDGRLWRMVMSDGRDAYVESDSDELLKYPLPPAPDRPGEWLPLRSPSSAQRLYQVSLSPYDWLIPGGRLFEVEAVLEDGRMAVGAADSPYADDPFFPTARFGMGLGMAVTMRLVRERPDMIPFQWSRMWPIVATFEDVKRTTAFSDSELGRMTAELLRLQSKASNTYAARAMDLGILHLLQYAISANTAMTEHRDTMNAFRVARLYAGLFAMHGMTFKGDGAQRRDELLKAMANEWARMVGSDSASFVNI